MRQAGHLVNDGIDARETTLPTIAGFDLELSAARVIDAGGDGRLYRHFLAAALAVDKQDVLALASISGWRSGAIGLRKDALSRLSTAANSAASEAALGLGPGELPSFLDAQAADPLGWPAAASGSLVARVGGFAGLGGPWLAPPVSAAPLTDGRFIIGTAAGNWVLEVDIFGHLLLPFGYPIKGPRAERLRFSTQSYLVAIAAP